MTPDARKKRALELLHLKLNALKAIQQETCAALVKCHRDGASELDVSLLGEDVAALVRIICSHRWAIDTPEAITMARVLQEIASPRHPEGASL